jgi:hypothetical protein
MKHMTDEKFPLILQQPSIANGQASPEAISPDEYFLDMPALASLLRAVLNGRTQPNRSLVVGTIQDGVAIRFKLRPHSTGI